MQKQKFTFSTFVNVTHFNFTFFGLPFILAGALLPFAYFPAADCLHSRWLLLVPAFLAARISGMAFNQLIDRQIDALNPRTNGRVLPAGKATLKQVRSIAWSSLIVFLCLTLLINRLCFFLAPLAAGLIYLYSYLKRFSWVCHFVLGSIHFLGPVMAFAAMSHHLEGGVVWLGLAAACSIIGNDMVYAIQDYYFDKKHHLHSAPVHLGVKGALRLARYMHVLSVISLVAMGLAASLRPLYFICPLLAGMVYMDFHAKVKPLADRPDQSLWVTPLFAKSNVTIALMTLFFVLIGLVWNG